MCHETSEACIDVHVLLTCMPMIGLRFFLLFSLFDTRLFSRKGKGKWEYVSIERATQSSRVDPIDRLVDLDRLDAKFLESPILAHDRDMLEQLSSLFHQAQESLHTLHVDS